MKNEDFKNIINQFLTPLGLKRRGNYWKSETEQLEKVCYLQKSYYSNLYYFNYGFNFKNLKYTEVTEHIGSRLSQSAAFDLENEMDDTTRTTMIKQLISSELNPKILLKTEADIIENLNTLTHPNAIAIKVKEYLDIKN